MKYLLPFYRPISELISKVLLLRKEGNEIMLLNNTVSIVQNLKIELTFDDNSKKEREIGVGDLIHVEFNDSGMRKSVEGKVLKIGTGINTVRQESWFIIVDGSLSFSGETFRFNPNKIIDLDIIQKKHDVPYIMTTNDSTRVTNLKVEDGILKVSKDNGYSWFTPNLNNMIQEEEGSDGDDNDSCCPPPKPDCGKDDKLDLILNAVKDMGSRIDKIEERMDEIENGSGSDEPDQPSTDDDILDESY